MSFKCESCNKVQPNGTKQTKVVTEIRNVTYPAIKDQEGRIKKTPIGFETVTELSVCPDCATKEYTIKTVDSKVII